MGTINISAGTPAVVENGEITTPAVINNLTLNTTVDGVNGNITASSTNMNGVNTITTTGSGIVDLGLVAVEGDYNIIDAEAKTNKITSIKVNDDSGVILSADEGKTITSGQATLNNGSGLGLNGSGNITIEGVSALGDSIIINQNAKTTLGTISVADGVEFELEGVKSTNHSGMKFTGLGTVNLVDSDTNDFTVESTETVTVNAIAGEGATVENPTISRVGTVTMAAGTPAVGENPAVNTVLNLNAAENSKLNATEVKMNGNNALNIGGYTSGEPATTTYGEVKLDKLSVTGLANTINNTNTNANTKITNLALTNGAFTTSGDANIAVTNTNVSGNNNSISSISANTNLGAITLTDAVLEVTGLQSNNYNSIALEDGTNNTINSNDSIIKDLTVGANTLNINAQTGTTTINNITSATDSASVIGLSAQNGATLNATIDTKITLNGNDGFGTSGKGAINLKGIDVTGTTNSINNQNTSTVYGTIDLQEGAGLAVTNIDASIPENASQKANFTFAGDNTIKSTNSNLGTFDVNAGKSLTVNSTGTTLYGEANLEAGSSLASSTKLALDATSGTILGTTTNLNSNSKVDISGDKAVTLTTVNVTGSSNLMNSTNTYSDTETNGVLINNINYTAADSELSLTGNYTVDNIDLVGANTLNTAGIVNIKDIDFSTVEAGQSTDAFTLNATSGATTIDTITLADDVALNLNLNANGGTISKTSATTVNSGDTLTLSGSSAITMGTITVKDGATFKNTNTSNGTTIGTTAMLGDSKLDTTSTTGTINTTTVDLSQAETLTWEADMVVNGTDVSSDKLAIAEDTSTDNAKVDLTLNVTGQPSTSTYFVDYIKVIDADKGILNTTSDVPTTGLVTLDNHMFYSYVNRDAIDPDDAKNTEYLNNFADNYAPNTIRVTNYDINSDLVLDKIILPGKRYQSLTTNTPDHIQDAILFDEAKQFYYPNMEARAGVENELTLHGIGKFIGQSSIGNSGQLFAVDTSKDNFSRTLNIQGFTTTKAVANYSAQSISDLKTRSDNGAALEIISGTGTDSAAAKVTLAEILEKTTQDGTFYNITPAFTHNMAQGNGGAIYMTGNKSSLETIDNTQVDFNTNVAVTGSGGAIYNDGLSDEGIKLDGNTTFQGNYAGASGGAIYNENGNVAIGSNDANTTTIFKNNYAKSNGAAHASLNNDFTVYSNAVYNNNISSGNGGAVSVIGGDVAFDGAQTFDGNYAAQKGGAIYAQGTTDALGNTKKAVINIAATKGNTEFKNNFQGATVTEYTPTKDMDTGEIEYHDASGNIMLDADGNPTPAKAEGGTSNAIYLDGDAELYLSTTEGNKIIFNDKIASNGIVTTNTITNPVLDENGNPVLDENGNPVTETITTTTVDSNNNVINQTAGHVQYNVAMDNFDGTAGFVGTFNLGSANTTAIADFSAADARPFQNSAYNLYGGSSLWLKNGTIIPINATSVNLENTSKSNPLYLTVDLDLTNEIADRFETSGSTSGNILVNGINTIGTSNKEQIDYEILEGATFDVAESQKYIKLDNQPHDYEVMGITGGLRLKKMAFDTAYFAPQVAVNARLAGQLDLYNQVLHRVDEIAEYRYFNKVSKNNLYAAGVDVIDDSRIDNTYTPYVNQEDGGNLWVKPSATIETINPTGQHKYNNRAYNAFLGYETPISTLKNGWELINTVFGGYQGSFQKYDNVKNYQNGGSAGYMANLYRNNFFSGGVVMLGGANVDVNDSGIRNRDMNFGLFDVGAAARVGYNVGMGKNWLFQPMLTTSYIYISGVDRHNDRGEKADLDGTNTLQIAPGFKLVGNYNGWQPYLLFDYTWPLIAKTVANVNNIDMPDVRLKSYVEYGAGLRKNVGERFTGYAEAVVRNGGRTGVSFQGGLVFKF